ncbi:MAG: hypothetical protein IJE78_04930 [Bacteroidaceae bacterium]|nr:hypothetical protein [Bacteroidaceae bacterium]
MKHVAIPSTKRPIKAAARSDGKPEGAMIAEQAAYLIEQLFTMNAHDELPLDEYLSTNDADTLNKAYNILKDFEHDYTVDERGY